MLQPEVLGKILGFIGKFKNGYLLDRIKELHIVGSITSNLYEDDSDVDVHIILDSSKVSPEEQARLQDELRKWQKTTERPYAGTHPIELYIQTQPQQDNFSVGLYIVESEKWVKGPKFFKLTYNPYKVYSDVANTIKKYADQIEIDLGELKRDLVDYTTIKKAIARLPKIAKIRLLKDLVDKYQEITNDIKQLLKDKKEIIELRRQSSKVVPSIDLGATIDLARWRKANAVMKFLDRYSYLKIITWLESLLEDSKLTPEEVKEMQKLLLPLVTTNESIRKLLPVLVAGSLLAGSAFAAPAIDAGHGGKDPGAVYQTIDGKEIKEKDITLSFVKALKKYVSDAVLIRDKDEYLSLKQRTDKANAVEPELVVSIHVNSSKSVPKIAGPEVWYYAGSKLGKEIASDLALVLNSKRGIKPTRNLYILKHTKAPAVLIELGFINNPDDLRNMLDPVWIDKTAREVAKVINRWKHLIKEDPQLVKEIIGK